MENKERSNEENPCSFDEFNLTIKTKSNCNYQLGITNVNFQHDNSNEIYILTYNIKENLGNNISSIELPQEIWKLGRALMFLKSRDTIEVLWIKPKDPYIYRINNLIHDDALIKFLQECLTAGFDSPAAIPPNISNAKNNVVITNLVSLRNKDEQDIMMYAIINECIDMISKLLPYNFDFNRTDKHNHASMYYAEENLKTANDSNEKKSSLNVIYLLLISNSTFTKNNLLRYCKESKKIQKFKKDMQSLRKNVENHELFMSILEKYPNLNYFFDINNQSLLTYLIKFNYEYVWEICERYNLKIAYHEYLDILKRYLNKKDENSTNIVIHILLEKFRNINGEFLQKEHRIPVKNALELLSKNYYSWIILKLNAAFDKLLIYIDFDVESESFEESGICGEQNGFTDSHGRIWIAGKNLTDNYKKNLAIDVIMHEMIHQAIQLTYINNFNPYPNGESNLKEKFINIFKESCQKRKEKNLIEILLKNYPEMHHHSELIVFALQMYIREPPNGLKKSRIFELVSIVFKDITLTIPILIKLQHETKTVTYFELTRPMQLKMIYSPFLYYGQMTIYYNIYKSNEDFLKGLNSLKIKEILLENKILIENDNDISKQKNIIDRRLVQSGITCDTQKNIQQIVQDINHSKLFVLSGVMGSGKSTTFKLLEISLRHLNPESFVSLVELNSKNQYLNENLNEIFDESKIIEILQNLFDIPNTNSKFEEYFKTGQLILLFDSFDSMCPKVRDNLIIMFQKFKQTNNILCISTRLHHTTKLERELNTTAYNFEPLTNIEISSYISSLLLIDSDQHKSLLFFFGILEDRVSGKEVIDNILMIKIFCEIFMKDRVNLTTLNSYEIFLKFNKRQQALFNEQKIPNNKKGDLELTRYMMALKMIFGDELFTKFPNLQKRYSKVIGDKQNQSMIQQFDFITKDPNCFEKNIFYRKFIAEFYIFNSISYLLFEPSCKANSLNLQLAFSILRLIANSNDFKVMKYIFCGYVNSKNQTINENMITFIKNNIQVLKDDSEKIECINEWKIFWKCILDDDDINQMLQLS